MKKLRKLLNNWKAKRARKRAAWADFRKGGEHHDR